MITDPSTKSGRKTISERITLAEEDQGRATKDNRAARPLFPSTHGGVGGRVCGTDCTTILQTKVRRTFPGTAPLRARYLSPTRPQTGGGRHGPGAALRDESRKYPKDPKCRKYRNRRVRTLLIMKFIRCIQIGHDYYGESRRTSQSLARATCRVITLRNMPGGRLLMLALAPLALAFTPALRQGLPLAPMANSAAVRAATPDMGLRSRVRSRLSKIFRGKNRAEEAADIVLAAAEKKAAEKPSSTVKSGPKAVTTSSNGEPDPLLEAVAAGRCGSRAVQRGIEAADQFVEENKSSSKRKASALHSQSHALLLLLHRRRRLLLHRRRKSSSLPSLPSRLRRPRRLQTKRTAPSKNRLRRPRSRRPLRRSIPPPCCPLAPSSPSPFSRPTR